MQPVRVKPAERDGGGVDVPTWDDFKMLQAQVDTLKISIAEIQRRIGPPQQKIETGTINFANVSGSNFLLNLDFDAVNVATQPFCQTFRLDGGSHWRIEQPENQAIVNWTAYGPL